LEVKHLRFKGPFERLDVISGFLEKRHMIGETLFSASGANLGRDERSSDR